MNKFAIAACIVALGGCVSYDRPSVQVDLAKVLVGTWQGEVHWGRMEPKRTLVIDSVIENDGKWVAWGRYGITGTPLGRTQIDIDRSGPRPVLRFVTGANSRVSLDLFDENNLVGTMALAGPGSGGSQHVAMKMGKLTAVEGPGPRANRPTSLPLAADVPLAPPPLTIDDVLALLEQGPSPEFRKRVDADRAFASRPDPSPETSTSTQIGFYHQRGLAAMNAGLVGQAIKDIDG